MLWNRNPGGNPVPAPPADLHPAQIDFIYAQRRIDACRAEIDDCLRRVGNGRPAMRDELLDLRLLLRTGAA